MQEADQESAEADLGQHQERLTVKQRADEKPVFDVNFQDEVNWSTPCLCALRCRWYVVLQRKSESETATCRVLFALLKEQSSRAQPEGDTNAKETYHRLIGF